MKEQKYSTQHHTSKLKSEQNNTRVGNLLDPIFHKA